VSYLLGDSSGPAIAFNYLAFLREVVDCAVVLLEAEATLSSNLERRDARANETAGLLRAVEELGAEATAVVEPVAKEQPNTPAGRCAAAIARAIKEAVETETAQAKNTTATAAEEVARDDQQARGKAKAVLEKLMRAHDLPEAEKELEASWSGGALKATMRQRTKLGLEATITLEPQGSALLAGDLRVDRVVEGVEVHAHEAGGFFKKSDKLVVVKLGRYQVIGLELDAKQVTVQLKAPDGNATSLIISVPRTGDITIEGGPAKEYEIDEHDRSGLEQLAAKLEAALHELEDHRTALVELVIDGKPFAEHPHPHVVAERLIAAIAPTVQLISRHSRSPGELVLRRQLADDRREEVFVSVADLTKKIDVLPVASRAVFAPLRLHGEAPAKADDAKLAAAINAQLEDS
jgi:hypothetical protein